MSSVYMDGLSSHGTSRGEKVIVGGATGVLTLWEKGAWNDQDERIYVHRESGGGESIETLATVPDELGMGKMVAVGLGNGAVKFVRLGPNKVVSGVSHDETEGVVGLGFDVEGRMVSGGGQIIKVWHEAIGDGEREDKSTANGKRTFGSDSEEDRDSSDSDGDIRDTSKRRKRKKGKSKDRSGGQHVMRFDGLD